VASERRVYRHFNFPGPILRAFIFADCVDGGTRRGTAAPYTRPCVLFNARSISMRSWLASCCCSEPIGTSSAGFVANRSSSSIERLSPFETMTEVSMIFLSSRIFPCQAQELHSALFNNPNSLSVGYGDWHRSCTHLLADSSFPVCEACAILMGSSVEICPEGRIFGGWKGDRLSCVQTSSHPGNLIHRFGRRGPIGEHKKKELALLTGSDSCSDFHLTALQSPRAASARARSTRGSAE
jgi:hypothetical protein